MYSNFYTAHEKGFIMSLYLWGHVHQDCQPVSEFTENVQHLYNSQSDKEVDSQQRQS